jgi:tripartite-type tricarboxylate transporter receptor subunit TctC
MLVASTSFPPNSLAEVIEYAKQNPGKVTVASTGVGTYTHLLGELFKQAAGIDTTHVPYANTASASVDLIAGRVNLMFHSTPAEIIGAGRAKGLAAVGSQRIKSLPGIPTMTEVLPTYRGSDNGWTLAAPASTPAEIVKKLSDAIATFSTSPDYAKDVESRGFVVSFSPYDQFPKQLREQYDAYGAAIRQGNIKIHN